MSVARAGEFGLIARVTARLASGHATLLGPGDDAAVVHAPDGRVVASTDVLVEGRHFRRDWASAVDIGHRAAAANLADIAAMGAVPTALLVALCMPPELEAQWTEELADGLAAEAARVGASVVGGDMSASPTSPSRSPPSATSVAGPRWYAAGPAPVTSWRSPVGSGTPPPVHRVVPGIPYPEGAGRGVPAT